MATISAYLGTDHSRCDGLFEELDAAVGSAQWALANFSVEEFSQALEQHFSMEENVLFLAFEKATGNHAGPTSVMRLEHQHLRGIMSRLAESIALRDAEEFFGHADTLRIMMQQHNLKEETVLYVMTDRILAGRQAEIIGAMDTLDKATAHNACDPNGST